MNTHSTYIAMNDSFCVNILNTFGYLQHLTDMSHSNLALLISTRTVTLPASESLLHQAPGYFSSPLLFCSSWVEKQETNANHVWIFQVKVERNGVQVTAIRVLPDSTVFGEYPYHTLSIVGLRKIRNTKYPHIIMNFVHNSQRNLFSFVFSRENTTCTDGFKNCLGGDTGNISDK